MRIRIGKLEQANSQRQKVEWGLPGPGREGNGELLFNGYDVSVWKDEKCSGDGWS